MHQYLLSVHHDDTNAIPEGVDVQDVFAAVDRFNTNQRIRTGRLPPDAERAHFGATPVTVIEDEPSLRFVRR